MSAVRCELIAVQSLGGPIGAVRRASRVPAREALLHTRFGITSAGEDLGKALLTKSPARSATKASPPRRSDRGSRLAAGRDCETVRPRSRCVPRRSGPSCAPSALEVGAPPYLAQMTGGGAWFDTRRASRSAAGRAAVAEGDATPRDFATELSGLLQVFDRHVVEIEPEVPRARTPRSPWGCATAAARSASPRARPPGGRRTSRASAG